MIVFLPRLIIENVPKDLEKGITAKIFIDSMIMYVVLFC